MGLRFWSMSAEDVLVDFFVKIRDACEEELRRLKPSEAENVKGYDPEKIGWVRTEGPKGSYERYLAFQQKPSQTTDYVNLIIDLKAHDGKPVHRRCKAEIEAQKRKTAEDKESLGNGCTYTWNLFKCYGR